MIKTNFPIPDEIWEDWQRAEAFAETLRAISGIKVKVAEALETGDVIFAEVTNTTLAYIQNIYGDLKLILPHAVCPTCQGRNRTKCLLCKGRGWISSFLYTRAIPEETRKLREKMVALK